MSAARGFLLDLGLCTGCSACELACSTENELGWGRSWRQVLTSNAERRPGHSTFHLSLACNHCERAPCVAQCPALAIERDPATGTVQIHTDRCIGCRYCSWVCPFDATRFDEGAGVMGKCTLCRHRLVEDRAPACVESCPTAALGYGPLEGDEEVPGFPRSHARPAIRFAPLAGGLHPPESTWEPDPQVVASFAQARPREPGRISLRSEWPLLVFTLLAAGLVGCLIAAALGGPGIPPLVLAALSALALATSSAHLGRKERAWRALLNVRRSWLSREVAAFGAFVALSLLASALPAAGPASPLGVAAALAGLTCLFCIDRVYDPLRRRERLDSSDTLLTGALVTAVLLAWNLPAVALLAVKLALYARQLAPTGAQGTPGLGPQRDRITSIDVLRVVAGILAAAALLLDPLRPAGAGVLLLLAAGELADRARFYRDLRAPDPRDELLRASPTSHPPIPGRAPAAT
jgi:Fe-S-cluster-containing dehydrogenase component/DMSO reductase anchor subunit